MLFRRNKDKTYNSTHNPKKFNKKYADSAFSQNTILADGVYMSMNTLKTRRNNNVLVIGGSGSGKNRFVLKPALLQANCSYIVTDSNKDLLETHGQFLEQKEGYKIKVFDLTDMSKSMHYNPFAYIRNEQDIITMVDCLMRNTDKGVVDPFFVRTEAHLLLALCSYLVETMPKEEQHFGNVLKLLNLSEMSPLDIMMENLKAENPESMAVKNYDIFKMAAGKSAKNVLIAALVRLQVFNMPLIQELTNDDTLDLASLGDEKQALFIVIPPCDDTFNFLASMLCTQASDTLFNRAESLTKKQLPIHVKFLLDEFANLGRLHSLDKRLALSRPYNISYTLILQSLSQLKAMYKKEWEVLVDNCDTLLYLGCQGKTTLDYINYRLGNRDKPQDPTSINNEFQPIPVNDCIVFVRGERPIYAKKYNPTKHQNYKYTADYDEQLLYKR